MGIALLALSGLFKNLPLGSSQLSTIQVTPKKLANRLHPEWATHPTPCASPTARLSPAVTRIRSLRVLHVHESGQSAAGAGRMVISGRMADVCAELDRLVAIEARQRTS